MMSIQLFTVECIDLKLKVSLFDLHITELNLRSSVEESWVQCPVEPHDASITARFINILHLTCGTGAMDDKDLAVSSDQGNA